MRRLLEGALFDLFFARPVALNASDPPASGSSARCTEPKAFPLNEWFNGSPTLRGHVHARLCATQFVDFHESMKVYGKLDEYFEKIFERPVRIPERFLARFEGAAVTGTLDIVPDSTSESPSGSAELGILLAQPGDMMFGHWVLDILPRLAATLPFLPKGATARLVLRDHADVRDLYSVFHDVVARLMEDPFEVLWLRPEDRVHFEELFVASVLRAGHAFPRELGAHFNRIRSAIRPVASLKTPSRVFASRAAWHIRERTLSDRDRIEATFRDFGFELFHPEQFSIEELMGYYANATCIAGERGSALHGAALAPNVSHFICLVGEQRSLACMEFAQAGLCAVLGMQSTFITGPTSRQGEVEIFSIGAERTRAVLKEVLSA